MKHHLRICRLSLFLFALLVPGCFGGARVAVNAASVLTSIAISSAMMDPEEPCDSSDAMCSSYAGPHRSAPTSDAPTPAPAYVYVPGDFQPIVAPDALDKVAVDEPGAAFDRGAARTSLHAVDLTPCEIITETYGHAWVTFAPEGYVAKVVIDAPAGFAEPTTRCVGEHLATARVPAFSGPSVTSGVSFYLR